jgi:hypothetical protein
MSDAIRVNGNLLSWGSLSMKIDGEPYFGFTSIQWAEKRERVLAWGMGRHHAPIGRSAGKYTPDPVKLVGWNHAIKAARLALAKRGSGSYGDVEFQIVLQGVEAESDNAFTCVFDRCVWTGNSNSCEESADPLKEEIEVSTMSITRDDLALYDTRGSAGGISL